MTDNSYSLDPYSLNAYTYGIDPAYEKILSKKGVAEAARRQKAAKAEAASRQKSRPVRRARPTPPLSPERVALGQLPKQLQPIVRGLIREPSMVETIGYVMGRVQDFPNPATALLTAVALDPMGRRQFDRDLSEMFAKNNLPQSAGEVVVGGGLHAAIYCAVRVAKGHPMPLVLERNKRVGGQFAVTESSAFFLNSRNRPGPLSIPGQAGALNVLPGAMVQPSNLGGSEFQTNDALGWVIRSALAMNAKVVTGVRVLRVSREEGAFNYKTDRYPVTMTLELTGGYSMTAKRVILATGLNEPRNVTGLLTHERVLTYESFMRRMDDPFPLRGMDRVAVLGGGDGGKTVIEALSGQGPGFGMSVAALDWPSKIDWYGAPYFDRDEFCENSRSRYQRIGSLLTSRSRVEPKNAAAGYTVGYDCVYVDEVPYDYIVDATGYRPGTTVDQDYASSSYALGGRIVGTKSSTASEGGDVFTVGPAANLAISSSEGAILRGISENSTSLFRYAPRTAALAADLPAV